MQKPETVEIVTHTHTHTEHQLNKNFQKLFVNKLRFTFARKDKIGIDYAIVKV